MDNLTNQLEVLLGVLRSFVVNSDQYQDALFAERFRQDLAMLIAEYGPEVISAALDSLPDAAATSISLH